MRTSYALSEILAKKMKPFSAEEMVNEYLTAVADIAFPDKKDKKIVYHNIVSQHPVARS
jgi:hypothetical protein